MKRIKMIVSAAIVFAAVGTAFAFKPLGAGSVFCFASDASVTQNLACDDTSQPTSTKVNKRVVTNGGSTNNPCTGTDIPYDGGTSNQCNTTVSGSTLYVNTLP